MRQRQRFRALPVLCSAVVARRDLLSTQFLSLIFSLASFASPFLLFLILQFLSVELLRLLRLLRLLMLRLLLPLLTVLVPRAPSGSTSVGSRLVEAGRCYCSLTGCITSCLCLICCCADEMR